MQLKTKITIFVLGWLIVISAAHSYLNVNWAAVLNDYRPLEKRKITVAYLPVTCQLTCPVTDYISKYSTSGQEFLPRMFQGFPEMKEALISNRVQAAFIVAPMALALKSQGVPIKVVYLGHRYGSAVVVRKDGPIKTFADMRGKTIAIPSRFSDERLLLFRAMKVWGVKPSEIKMVEMAPPDVSGALAAHAIDAFVMGEPFPSQAEIGGYGRVLFQAREYWPDYVLHSCREAGSHRPPSRHCSGDGRWHRSLGPVARYQQATSRRRRRLRRPLLLQPKAGTASLGAYQADGQGRIQSTRTAQSRL
jgi:NitT/TauT family transport system substrate-binding protein